MKKDNIAEEAKINCGQQQLHQQQIWILNKSHILREHLAGHHASKLPPLLVALSIRHLGHLTEHLASKLIPLLVALNIQCLGHLAGHLASRLIPLLVTLNKHRSELVRPSSISLLLFFNVKERSAFIPPLSHFNTPLVKICY